MHAVPTELENAVPTELERCNQRSWKDATNGVGNATNGVGKMQITESNGFNTMFMQPVTNEA
jgi:hypothetical protein